MKKTFTLLPTQKHNSTPEKVLQRVRRIVRGYGQRVLTSRVDNSYYIISHSSGFLVWPQTLAVSGSGGTLEELLDFVGGHHR